MMKKYLTLALLLGLNMAYSIHVSAKVNTPFSGYLFAYFEGGGDKNLQEQLRFAVSEDAVNWYAMNGNRPIIASDSISESGSIRNIPPTAKGVSGLSNGL